MENLYNTFIAIVLIIFSAEICNADNMRTINPKWVSVDSINEIQLIELNGFKVAKVVRIEKNGNISEIERNIDSIMMKACSASVDTLNEYVMIPIIKELYKNKQSNINNRHDNTYCEELGSTIDKGNNICIDELPMYRMEVLNTNYDEFIERKRYVLKILFGKHRVYYTDLDNFIVSYNLNCCDNYSIKEVYKANQDEYLKNLKKIEYVQDSLINQK